MSTLFEGSIDEMQQKMAKLSNQNRRYYNNLHLAMSMAFWATLFGLPVYSEYMSWLVFGNNDRCPPNKMGLKANIGTEKHPILANFNSTLVKEGYEVYAWCGFLPFSYFAAWPGVVQTMIFTLSTKGTGSTVKLAWQGCCGTFFAVLNIYCLSILYPEGAKDPNYPQWVGWLDIAVVLFLFLATKADTNTMMYGMSWSVALMLHFMNPNTGTTLGTYESPIPYVNWDGETTVDMLTAIMGCCLAIVATIFPRPMMNIWKVHTDCEEIVKGIDRIFEEAIQYWAGQSSGPKRYAVYAKMGLLTKAVDRVQRNLADVYWETFDLCGFGKIRKLYQMFYEAVSRNSDEVFLLKSATQALNFDGPDSIHKEVVGATKDTLLRLKNNAIKCLQVCGAACRDGVISAEEKANIEAARNEIFNAQQDLSNKFQIVLKELKVVCNDASAAESLFLFSIAQWAEESSDFAQDLGKFEEDFLTKHSSWDIINTLKTLMSSFASTFDPAAAFDKEQLRFVAINLAPIIITFWISMEFNGSVFVEYSPTMPSLLTLLVTGDHFIPFIKNAQRLTGVVFGHTLPLLVMSVISMLACDSYFRFGLHMISIFLFFFMFTFMYYASDQWGSLGCCIAGFGVYTLFVQCSPDAKVDYGSHYKAIAQVIIAIMLKILFSNVFMKSEPRDEAIVKLDLLNTSIKDAFQAFFDCDTDKLSASRDQVKTRISACESLATLTDPSLAIVPGFRTPFKYHLYQTALTQFRLILSDIDMLCLAMAGHQKKELEGAKGKETAAEKQEEEKTALLLKKSQEKDMYDIMQKAPAFKTVRDDLTSTINVTLGLLKAVLEHSSEEPMESKYAEQMKKMTKVSTLEGKNELYEEVSQELAQDIASQTHNDIFQDKRIVTQLKRTRLTVAMNALSLTLSHNTGISSACFDNMIYA